MRKNNELKINSDSINIDFFKKATKFVLKKREVRGFIIGMTGMLTAFSIVSSISDSHNTKKAQNVSVTNETQETINDSDGKAIFGPDVALAGLGASYPYTIGLDEVNSLNIIINDNKFSSNLFSDNYKTMEFLAQLLMNVKELM